MFSRTLFCRLQPVVLLLVLGFAPLAAQSQQIQTIDERDLQQLLTDKSDTLHIVNFWATWCKPCVKELPYFTQIREENRKNNVKVTFVSVDFPEDVETRLYPFLNRNKQLPQPMRVMKPANDQWINEVNKDWSGAIPATVIYNSRRNIYFFVEGDLTLEQLRKYVLLNQTSKP